MESMEASDVRKAVGSPLERSFLEHWKLIAVPLGLPMPEQQVRFCPGRKFQWDFCFLDQKLAVELDGGSYIKGGHNTAKGQYRDHEKSNEATRLGWRVLRFNTISMKDPVAVVDFVIEVLCDAKEVADGEN